MGEIFTNPFSRIFEKEKEKALERLLNSFDENILEMDEILKQMPEEFKKYVFLRQTNYDNKYIEVPNFSGIGLPILKEHEIANQKNHFNLLIMACFNLVSEYLEKQEYQRFIIGSVYKEMLSETEGKTFEDVLKIIKETRNKISDLNVERLIAEDE